MHIERLHTLHLIDELNSLLMYFFLSLPECFIFGQFGRINCHLDDFSICLELFENIDINVTTIVNILIVLHELLLLPLTQ